MKRFFGPLPFYKKVAILSIPIVLQQLLSSTMGIVDAIMVARIDQVTAVGTAAQIDMFVNVVCYGASSGAGVFVAQFFGAKDPKGQRKTFGLIFSIVTGFAFLVILCCAFFGREILSFLIKDPIVIENSLIYLHVAMWSYLPAVIVGLFSFCFRSIQQNRIPTIISIFATVLHVILNYLLIFGNYGFPEMGIRGAAMGSVIAQWSALLIILVYSILTKPSFIGGVKELFARAPALSHKILTKTFPMIYNEFFFMLGSILMIKAFGQLGTQAMDAYYVGNQVTNIFYAAIYGLSSAVIAMLGAALGAGNMVRARQEGDYFIGMGLIISLLFAVVILLTAPWMVSLFGLSDPGVIAAAEAIIRIVSIRIGFRMFNIIIFSAIRVGGDSRFLSFLDAGVEWACGIPLAFFMVNVLGIHDIVTVFFWMNLEQAVRLLIGWKRFTSDRWIVNLAS
ncbi:MAG: MATE family efflux transporter [Erysipelotrichaceae bacterium]|jgi:putative MATE family efflux protein|nr:MATE family efflux transporter [Erysipelotrichaceae bacterium]